MHDNQQPTSVVPARPPTGRNPCGIQEFDCAFLIPVITADAAGEAELTDVAAYTGLRASPCHDLISRDSAARRAPDPSCILGSRVLLGAILERPIKNNTAK